MKRLNLIGIGLIVSITVTFSQKGIDSGTRYGLGEDSIRCVRNLSLYSEDFKNKNFDDAYPTWLLVIEECPKATQNLYIDGPTLVKNKMDKTTDPEEIEALYQLLMRVYDMRIEHFGNDRRTPTAAIKGLKAIEMLNYRDNRSKPEIQQEAYSLLNESVNGMLEASQIPMLVNFIQLATQIYRQGNIDVYSYIENFTKVTDIVDARLKVQTIAETVRNNLEHAKMQAEQWFAETDAANCENLENIFGSQLEENKEDLIWLKRVGGLLLRKDCRDSRLFYQVAEYQHAIEPSAASAYGLATMNLRTEKIDVALDYFMQAIDLAENNDQKARFLDFVAQIHLSKHNYQQVRVFSLRAIEARPNWGAPYILIGRAYAQAASSVGQDDFEQKTVYWAAVDKFLRARAVDSSCAEEASGLIRTYQSHFPSSEELFMQGYKIGENYTVGGWINERTTIRERQ